MSTIDCGACETLRSTSPEFIQNGVTDTIAASLKNNTGLNPGLTVTHTDCEDLNAINDCIIGRLDGELEAYDVCDWKPFMHKLLPNLYETLKAMIASICGLWTKVSQISQICASLDTMLKLIRGDAPTVHWGTAEQAFLDKMQFTVDGVDIDKHEFAPHFDADIIQGGGCSSSKRIGRWQLNAGFKVSYYPRGISRRVITDLAVGDVLGVVPRSAVPASDFSDSRWQSVCRTNSEYAWYVLNGDTLVYVSARGYVIIDGQEYNTQYASYGEGNLVFYISAFIGPSRQGRLANNFINILRTYEL